MISHDIELKHSVVSGKFELTVDGSSLGSSKKNSSKGFFHRFFLPAKDQRLEIIVRVDQSTTGSCYDLLVNGLLFNDAEAISLVKFLDLKKSIRNSREKPIIVKRLSYQDFTGSSFKSVAKDQKETIDEKSKPDTQTEGNLLGMDFQTFHDSNKPQEKKEKVVDDFLSFT